MTDTSDSPAFPPLAPAPIEAHCEAAPATPLEDMVDATLAASSDDDIDILPDTVTPIHNEAVEQCEFIPESTLEDIALSDSEDATNAAHDSYDADAIVPFETDTTEADQHIAEAGSAESSNHASALATSAETPAANSLSPNTATDMQQPNVPSPRSPSITTSTMFLVKAMKTIMGSREARRSKELADTTIHALSLLEANDATAQIEDDVNAVFIPLKLACQTGSIPLTITAIDCIEKLISYKLIGSDARDALLRQHANPEPAVQDSPSAADTEDAANVEATTTEEPERLPETDTAPTEEPTAELAVPEEEAAAPISAPVAEGEENLEQAPAKQKQTTIIDDIVAVVCKAFIGENTDDKVTLQIIKALLAAVSQSERPIHQSTLLRAVRTTYNIFLLSSNPANQTIAQGTLTQMVNIVFTRVRLDPKLQQSIKTDDIAVDTEDATEKESPNMASSETAAAAPATEDQDVTETASTSPSAAEASSEAASKGEEATSPTPVAAATDSASATDTSSLAATDVEIRDAYLVFRALCKLSMNPVNNDSATDLRSLSMRSKLLALHLVLDVIASHQLVFLAPAAIVVNSGEQQSMSTTTFITTVKQHLCLTLSRNLVSVIPAVFECALELFWQVLSNFRMFLKKEIEVFFTEIFLPILEMKNSPFQQRLALLSVLTRICDSPQMLVELYLNYDCDRDALGNIYERLVNVLSKITTSRALTADSGITLQNAPAAAAISAAMPLTSASVHGHLSSAASMAANTATADASIRYKSLESLVSVLRSLVQWSDKSDVRTLGDLSNSGSQNDEQQAGDARSVRTSIDTVRTQSIAVSSSAAYDIEPISEVPNVEQDISSSSSSVQQTPKDDPEQFSHRKQRKQLLEDGVRLFAWKPKKGIRSMIASGIIASDSPQDIAYFLLHTEGIDKTMLGEYLGEGETYNIAIMHAFVDLMDFSGQNFVSSLRIFLQSFRLPGEAQKIDRFMLKFAERYVMYHPSEFANADTAYVLAYSVVMLNTDQHNRQIKKRMTKEEFIRNNRGINDGADVPAEYLEATFDEIRDNEIKMNDWNDSTIRKATAPEHRFDFDGLSQRQKREAYAIVSEELAYKTEAVFRSIRRGRNRRTAIQESVTFFNASHADHVKPMFEIPWMAFLAALSSPLQDSNDPSIVRMCLEGFRFAVHIVAAFEMDLARDAFISTLAKFTHLSNLNEMKPKNAKAIKCLLAIALAEGNALKSSWTDILLSVSRLERVQLITGGVDEAKVPELSHGRRTSIGARSDGGSSVTAVSGRRSARASNIAPTYDEETAMEASSQEVVIMVDQIFTTSVNLSGSAIKDFVTALSQVSWEEIQSSSAHTDHPRIFSLQKLVEISYYNMNRIRLEWSYTWPIIGDHFIQVGSQSNQNACIFAIDSLRQLSMKFLEKEELSNFKFQREFLKPFVHIISHSSDPAIRDMVIRCLNQMIAARSKNIRSGWKTILCAFVEAAKDTDESIVTMAFNNVKIIFTQHYTAVVDNGSLSDLVSCFIEFCRNGRYQKISLQSIEMFRQIMDRITDQRLPSFDSLIASGNFALRSQPVAVPAATLDVNAQVDDIQQQQQKQLQLQQQHQQRIWIPIFFGLFEVVMDCSDLEVRTRALDILFDALRKHGVGFGQDLWSSIFDGIVFPIFNDIKVPGRRSRFASADDMTVWFSTTLIKALRNVINLFTFYFNVLRPLLDNLFDLLCACVSQDDEIIAKAGCSCLLELIERNADKLEEGTWNQVCTTFVRLLKTTSPYAAMAATKRAGTSAPVADAASPAIAQSSASGARSDLTDVQRCSMYCSLQLTILQTVRDMFNGPAYAVVHVDHLFSLVDAVARCYRQAQKFNKSVQMMESHPGFVSLMPQLLEQEIGCLTGCIHMLMIMYTDNAERMVTQQAETERRLFPLSMDTLHRYGLLTVGADGGGPRADAFALVVVGILTMLNDLPEDKFRHNLTTLYSEIIHLLEQMPSKEVRRAMHRFLRRVGEVYELIGDDTESKS